MNIPKGYRLVPVEPTNEMVAAIQDRITVTSRGGKIGCKAALREAIEVSPTPPQPIYDEAKEMELFEVWALEEIGPYFNKPEDCLLKDRGRYVYGQTVTSCQAWLACAQSRAKAGEVGHE